MFDRYWEEIAMGTNQPLRADWKAIRLVYHMFGHEAAREWAETPLLDTESISMALPEIGNIDLPAPGFLTRLPLDPVVIRLCRPNPPGVACRIKSIVMGLSYTGLPPGTTQLPFPLPDGTEAKPSDSAAFHMTFIPEIEKLEIEILKNEHPNVFARLALQAFYHPKSGQVVQIVGLAADCGNCGDKEKTKLTPAMLVAFETYREIERLGLHAVEVSDCTPETRGPMKAHHEKPWTREDLRSAILINFADAKKYGHRVDHGGTHASPIPHTRRGHFFTLRHARYGKHIGDKRWRSPAWVGDTEWIFEGRQYRVIAQKNDPTQTT